MIQSPAIKFLFFRVGSFKKLCLSNETVSLVTTAEAAHWFYPIEDFYSECKRVLTDNGVLAVIFYTFQPSVYSTTLDGTRLETLTREVTAISSYVIYK